MSGQEVNTWLDFCYEGDTDEYDEELELIKRRSKQEEYDDSVEEELNNLYNY